MNVQRNIEARWCNHSCSGKAMGITYSGCVFVALVIQRAMRFRHIVIYSLSIPAKFFLFVSYKARFSIYIYIYNIKCVLIFSTTFFERFDHKCKVLVIPVRF